LSLGFDQAVFLTCKNLFFLNQSDWAWPWLLVKKQSPNFGPRLVLSHEQLGYCCLFDWNFLTFKIFFRGNNNRKAEWISAFTANWLP
jgi:hypothetical protein